MFSSPYSHPYLVSSSPGILTGSALVTSSFHSTEEDASAVPHRGQAGRIIKEVEGLRKEADETPRESRFPRQE